MSPCELPRAKGRGELPACSPQEIFGVWGAVVCLGQVGTSCGLKGEELAFVAHHGTHASGEVSDSKASAIARSPKTFFEIPGPAGGGHGIVGVDGCLGEGNSRHVVGNVSFVIEDNAGRVFVGGLEKKARQGIAAVARADLHLHAFKEETFAVSPNLSGEQGLERQKVLGADLHSFLDDHRGGVGIGLPIRAARRYGWTFAFVGRRREGGGGEQKAG